MQHGGLDRCSIGHSLIWVDGFVQLFAAEVVLKKLLDLGNTGGATDHDDLMDLRFIHASITQALFHWLQGVTEKVSIQLLKTSTGDGGVEINTVVEGVDLDGGPKAGGQGTLGTLTGGMQTTHSTLVVWDVLLEPALELLHVVVHHAVVKVFSSQMGVTSCCPHLEETILNGQDGHIKCTASKIEDKHVLLSIGLLFETVGNGSSRGLVDDPKNVETSDDTSILGGLTLKLIEISRYSDHGTCDALEIAQKNSLSKMRCNTIDINHIANVELDMLLCYRWPMKSLNCFFTHWALIQCKYVVLPV